MRIPDCSIVGDIGAGWFWVPFAGALAWLVVSYRRRSSLDAMRICVFGAGAIGGYLAVGLARAGHDVSVVDRGAHLQARHPRGLRLGTADGGGEKTAAVRATDDPAALGVQDLVICALKAHQSWENAERFAPLLGPDTAVVTAMNGFSWWYFHAAGSGPLEGHALASVDPGARQWRAIGPERAIGCVVEPACEVVSPGVVLHRRYNRFTLGEPDGSRSARVAAASKVLVDGRHAIERAG